MREGDEALPLFALHIGLPKTGTTFLQHRVFPPVKELTFLHRKGDPREVEICIGFRNFARWKTPLFQIGRFLLERRLRTYLAGMTATGDRKRLLISDENISVLADTFWTGRDAPPDLLAERLAGLAHRTPFGMPRVIIGIRRQDQWLASRYAESSKHFPEFSQDDFTQRMARLTATEVLPGPLGWLDYDHVEKTFAAALGRENVLLLPLEQLSNPQVFASLGDLLDLDLGSPPSAAKAGRHRNQLSQGENVWKMRGGGELRLEPDVQADILSRFAASNAALSDRLPLGF